MEHNDTEVVVSSFGSSVTVLQYLLQNEPTGSVGEGLSAANSTSTTTGVDSSVRVYSCVHPGCKKLYFNERHLRAHGKYHGGEAPCDRKQASNEDGKNVAEADSQEAQSGLRFLLLNGQSEVSTETQEHTETIATEDLAIDSMKQMQNEKLEESIAVADGEDELIQYDEDYCMRNEPSDGEYDGDLIIAYDGTDCEEEEVIESSSQQDLFNHSDCDGEEILFLEETKQLTYSTKDRKYACGWPLCGKTYIKVSHLKVHQRSHTGELPFECGWAGCKQRFARSETLNRHLVTHTSDRNHNCRWCDKRFFRRDHLLAHVRRHNLPNSEIQQLFPGVKIATKQGSKECEAPATMSPPVQNSSGTATTGAIVPEPDPRRTFRCSYEGCNKTYTRHSHLKAHELLHTGTLTFHCPWVDCGAAFARSYELSRHRRMHSGERKFVCHICQQAFIRSDHLSSHVKRHTFQAVRIASRGEDVLVKLKIE
ncbi:zinc finger protein 420-like [Anopheles moucheti]|uniref:zinc finger protein 420-like n=1 Tax=Anopheles moucheti TaxID=186751 RepID=UPI0022F11956|nr:zinc finger protein 420-like [Anopheles moucheti]